jgi:hypothetical protein
MAQHSSRGILPLNPLRNDYVRPAERGVVLARICFFAAAKRGLLILKRLNQAKIY